MFEYLTIMYEVDREEVCFIADWEQHNETDGGKELTNFNHRVGALIENDIVDIVGFMRKYLY